MKLNAGSIKDRLAKGIHTARKYAVVLFTLFLIIIYGFLGWRIITLQQAEPDPSLVTAELKTVGVPKIDQDAIDKIEKLQDNSVSVKTLFDDARRNPFQE